MFKKGQTYCVQFESNGKLPDSFSSIWIRPFIEAFNQTGRNPFGYQERSSPEMTAMVPYLRQLKSCPWERNYFY